MKNQKMPPKTELATQLEQALKNIGIRVLTNEAVNLPLENQDSDLYLVGIGSNWANNDKLDKIAQDFEQLLKDENLQEIVDSDSISEINRNTFVPLISDRIYLSQQDVQHIASTQIRKQEVWD